MHLQTSGDIGDIIAMLAVAKTIPNGPHRILLQDLPGTAGIVHRRHIIAPLAEAQDYISECRPLNGDNIDWRSSDFRIRHHSLDKSLVMAHGLHAASMGMVQRDPDQSIEPWLKVTPSEAGKGRVIVARSTRYRNCWFPWDTIVKFYGSMIMFVGLPDEHRDFCGNFGQVDYRQTHNMLELAELIAGSLLFIGNQSSPFWCAQGLHHPRILEVCLNVCDSICAGGDAQFSPDGAMTLPGFDGALPLKLDPRLPYARPINTIDTSQCPPNGWHYKGMSNTSLQAMILMAKRAGHGDDMGSLRLDIIKENIKRRPDFFADDSHLHTLSLYRNAMAQQGLEVKNPVPAP